MPLAGQREGVSIVDSCPKAKLFCSFTDFLRSLGSRNYSNGSKGGEERETITLFQISSLHKPCGGLEQGKRPWKPNASLLPAMHGYIVVTTGVFWRVLHVLGNFCKATPTDWSLPLEEGVKEKETVHSLGGACGVGAQRGGGRPDPELPAAQPRLCCTGGPVFRSTEALCATSHACACMVCVCVYICVYRPEEARVSMFHVCVCVLS